MHFPARARYAVVLAAALVWSTGELLRAVACGPERMESPCDAAEAAVPFQVGERLDYRVGWQDYLTAATAEMRVVERRAFRGRTAWHFQGRARTVEPLRFLYARDDQFDSYTDCVSLAGLQYETYLREAGREENAVVRMTTAREPSRGDGPEVRVPEGTRDPLGAFFLLRATDWEKTAEVRTPVFDGKKLYELFARKSGAPAEVRVPAGEYTATRIELRVRERGRELAETQFRVWLAGDAARTPVLIEAVLPVGEFRVELLRAR